MGTIPMFAPDGSIGDVPRERMAEAQKAGFKIGVDMLSPDGQRGTIPQERMLDASAKGFRPVAPTGVTPEFTPDAKFNSAINQFMAKSEVQAALAVLPAGAAETTLKSVGEAIPSAARAGRAFQDLQ